MPSARGLAAEAALAEAPVAGAAAATAHAAAARAAAPRQPPTLEQLVEFRENVAAFTQSYVKPRAAEIDRLGGLPPGFDFWTKAGDWGLHGEAEAAAVTGAAAGCASPRLLPVHTMAARRRCRYHGADCAGGAGPGPPAPRDSHGGNVPGLWGW